MNKSCVQSWILWRRKTSMPCFRILTILLCNGCLFVCFQEAIFVYQGVHGQHVKSIRCLSREYNAFYAWSNAALLQHCNFHMPEWFVRPCVFLLVSRLTPRDTRKSVFYKRNIFSDDLLYVHYTCHLVVRTRWVFTTSFFILATTDQCNDCSDFDEWVCGQIPRD